MAERWRQCRSHPLYEVSDEGHVRRAVGGRGAKPGYILTPMVTGHDPYPRVDLYDAGREYAGALAA